MVQSNVAKLKRFLTSLFKKIELGTPFKISFQGDTAHINQATIDSVKEKHGGFLTPLIRKVMSFIKRWDGLLPLAALLPLIFGGIAAAGGQLVG